MSKKKSMKGKGSYAVYKTADRFQKNRVRKLERQLKEHPNNDVLKKALELTKKGLGRKIRQKPRGNVWKPGTIAFAQALSGVGINGNMALIPLPNIEPGDAGAAKKIRDAYAMEWKIASDKRDINCPGIINIKARKKAA